MDVDFLKYRFEDGYTGVIVKNGFKIGVRHIQMVYMVLCSAALGSLRGSTAVAVLAMTDRTRLNDTYIQIHNWDRKIQGTIMSAFFIGYAMMLVPAQLFLKKTGGKLLLTAVLIINGALSVAMPTIANKGGWIAVCNAQLWMGMTQACLSPANQSLIKTWLPPNERGIFSCLVYAGVPLGIVIGLPISGILSEARLGWELIFYSQAMLSLSMAAIWVILTASSPDQHQAVGDAEKEYIKECLSCYHKKILNVPWRSIFKCRHFWAVTCAHAASNAIFIFYLVDAPAYLMTFKISLRDSTLRAALPFAAIWLMNATMAPSLEWIGRTLQLGYHVNVTYFRKLVNALGASGVVVGLTILGNLSPRWGQLGVFVLTGTLALLGFQFSGFLETHKDMSQNYSGTLLMLSSGVASVVGALLPLTTGHIIGDEWTDIKRWRLVFLTLASLYAICNILYTALGSSDRQLWDGGTVVKDKFGYHNTMIEPPNHQAPKGFGARHGQVLILFISLSIGYSMRAHLSVSMVAMTGSPIQKPCQNVTANDTVFMDPQNVTGNDELENATDFVVKETGLGNCEEEQEVLGWTVYRTYKWNKPTQEMILFSFFVGYTTMMIPMGILAQKFGGKIPIMIALGANGLLSLLTPWLPIFGGWLAVCGCRLLQGMTQAAFYPSIHTLLGKWAPLSERGRLSTYVYTGSQFGTVLAFQFSGLFAGSPTLGWPSTFWTCGVASLACFVLYAWLGAATPHQHKSISTEELMYIIGDGSADVSPKRRRTPWMQILTSVPVWGLVSAHIGSAMCYLFILTQIPLYMKRVLNVDIKRNGVYSSLPYICMYFTALLFGFLSDFCGNRKLMSVANIRRVSNSIGMAASSLFLIGFSYVEGTGMAVLLLVIFMGLHSGVHVGFHINHLDLAPNFSGPIMALGNMLANLSSLLVPVLVSNILGDDVTNQHKWQILFIIMSSIQLVTNLVFVIVVKAKVQPWNFHDEDRIGYENNGMSELNKHSDNVKKSEAKS